MDTDTSLASTTTLADAPAENQLTTTATHDESTVVAPSPHRNASPP